MIIFEWANGTKFEEPLREDWMSDEIYFRNVLLLYKYFGKIERKGIV